MPVVTCRIDAVKERSVRGGRKFDVYPVKTPGADWTPVYETFDAFKASACERARQTGRRVTLGLKESRFGLEIVTAAIEDDEPWGGGFAENH